MKKSLIFVVAMIVATLTVPVNSLAQKGNPNGISTNIKDFRSKGLALIPPVDPFYIDQVSQLSRKNESSNRFVNIMRPFSVLLRNDNNQAMVAYRLKWTLQNPKGENIVFYTSYRSPSFLMNLRVINKPGSKYAESDVIRSGSHRVMSLVPSNLIMSTVEDRGQPQELINAAQEFVKKFAKTPFVNVELDGAFLANGLFIGDQKNNFFDHVLAQVRAKHDLLIKIKRMQSSNVNSNEIFASVKTIVDQPDRELNEKAKFADYYFHFRKVYAEEILNIREALKNDNQTLNEVLKPLSGAWVNLRRENS